MKSKQDYVNDLVSQLPQAVQAISLDDLNKWASGEIASSQRDREFAIYQAEGLTQHLKNVVLCYLDIASVGYDSFDNEKKKQGDQYRGYLARARAVYDMAVAELGVLQSSGASPAVTSIQQGVIASELANYKTWVSTYNTSIANGSVE